MITGKFVSVVIPALNEEISIGWTLQRVKDAFEKYKINGEIIVVDASSTDKTVEIAKEYGAKVYVVPKIWLWYQYKRSLEWITGDYIIMWDSDGTYDFMEMDRIIRKLDEGYDFVMGTRLKGNIHPGAMPWKNRYIGTPLLTFFINLFFNAHISDCNSGLRGLTTESFKTMKLESPAREYASEMVIKWVLCKLKMTEVPVSLLPDQKWRMPHLTPWKAWRQNMKYIWLLASEVIFMKLGSIISFIGLIILFSQIAGPITIGDMTFGTYYLFLWLICTTLGFSIFQMGVLTQCFSYLSQFRVSSISNKIKEWFSFEKWIIIWVISFAIWFIFHIVVLVSWLIHHTIEITQIKLGIYWLFFIISAIQSIYFSFMFYLFNRYKLWKTS